MIIKGQIDCLRALEDGWLDGREGTNYTPAFLDQMELVITNFTDNYKVPLPYIYPNPEGSVQVEWITHDYEIIARLYTNTIEVIYFSTTDKESLDDEIVFDLNDPESVKQFYELIFNILSEK